MVQRVTCAVVAGGAVDEADDLVEARMSPTLGLDRSCAIRCGLGAGPALRLSGFQFGDLLEEVGGEPFANIGIVSAYQRPGERMDR